MDPLILAKLKAFAGRRRRLLLWRGILVAGALLFGGMMLIAVLDRYWFLPDWARWLFSAAIYGAVLLVTVRVGFTLLWHQPDARRLARLVEHTAPEMHEDLLSAVELGQEETHFDSPRFRQLVQEGVAGRMAGLETERLLPTHLLRRSAAWAGAVAVLLVGILIFTRLQFGAMLLRAFLPTANLARVSTVQVSVLAPTPAEASVPQGDSVPLVIETSGAPVDQAFLETFSANGSHNLVQMTPTARNRFSAQIEIARDDVEYRVRAGDALTRKYHLQAAARPHVVRFHKAYRFPEYAQLPVREAVEESGDLAALEGTTVELTIETDQVTREAELRLETGAQATVVSLEAVGEHRLRAEVPLNASGTYRVHLVAAASGFENKFSPEYELRAEPDLLPKIELTSPERDVVATNSELLEITGTASDDLALARLEQLYRANEGPWQTRRLLLALGPTAQIEMRWDLAQENFRPGDVVTLKLAAVDRKGSRGESRTLQITLAAAGFDSRRAAALTEKQRLEQAVTVLAKAGELLEKRVNELRSRAGAGGIDEARLKQASLAFESALDAYEQKAQSATAQLSLALHTAEPGHDAGELVQLGRSLSLLQASTEPLRWTQRQAFGGEGDPAQLRDYLREGTESARWIFQHGEDTAEACRAYVASEEIDLATENLLVAWKEQSQLVQQAGRAGTAPEPWARVAGRSHAILAEAAQIQQLYQATTTHATGAVQERLEGTAAKLSEQQAAYRRALQAPPAPALLGAVQNFGYALADSLKVLLQLKTDYLKAAVEPYFGLRRELKPAWDGFGRMRQECEETLRERKLPEGARPPLAYLRWELHAGAWKSYGDWEEARPDADTEFVQDLRALNLALPVLRGELTASGERPERAAAWSKLATLDRAFRLLETGHDLAETASAAESLAAAEQWEGISLRARTSHPADWHWLLERMKLQGVELNHLQLGGGEMAVLLPQVQTLVETAFTGPPAKAVQAEMEQRFDRERTPVPVAAETRRVAEQMRAAVELLRPAMLMARQQMETLTPKLSERMAQLAQQAAELRRRTEQSQARPDEGDEARAEAQQQLAEQRRLDGELEAVKDAVRSDAHRQDLMEEEGRERARDADDALAMLREPPPRAEQALEEAAAGDQPPEERAAALRTAAEEQQKLTQALEKLAEHYESLEKGEKSEQRTALRQEEEKLGVKQELDAQYEQAKRLAEAAKATPEEMLKKLEAALPQNPVMRQELGNVSQNTLEAAGQKLFEAAEREQRIAQTVQKLTEEAPTTAEEPPAAPVPADPDEPAVANPKLADAASMQTPISEVTGSAGDEVERSGRHEERLSNPVSGRELQRLGKQIQQTATETVPKALEALSTAKAAQDAQPAVQAASQRLQDDLQGLSAAASATPEVGSAPAPGMEVGHEGAPARDPAAVPGGASASPSAAPAPTATASAPPVSASVPGAPSPLAGAPLPPATPRSSPEAAPFDEETFDPAALPAPNTTASPEQQVWMARALDSLDSAVFARNSQPPPNDESDQKSSSKGQSQEGAEKPAGESGKPGDQQGEGKDGDSSAQQAMAQAQQAMSAAAQAQAASMRSNRTPPPAGDKPAAAKGGEQALSKTGTDANKDADPYGVLPNAGPLSGGDWGKLPKKMAEQLTQGQHESVASEYRHQVETYYRVIGERAKKP